MMHLSLHGAALSFLAIAAVRAQDLITDLDPIDNFCRRFGHQTTVIDRRLYIDGGYVDYGGSISPETVNYTSTYLIYLDLDDLVENFPIAHANLSKPSNVPSVIGGALWADTVNKYIYLYGGEYNWTTLPSSPFNLWSYDVIYDEWKVKERDSTMTTVLSASFGASAVIDDRILAYYYGGWVSNATTLGWNGNPAAQYNLIKYDMTENIWDIGTFVDSTPRAEGVMFYIPASGRCLYKNDA